MSAAGFARLAAAIEAAAETKRPPGPDWYDAASDLLDELLEVIRHADDGRSADAAMAARVAISDLAGLWFTPDETDAIYLAPPAGGHAVTVDPTALCGAQTIFWPDDECSEAECSLPAGHEPADVHCDDILGEWSEDDLPTHAAAHRDEGSAPDG